ncbi:hypothetical protein SK128_013214 [Halocaridina rubra]|uniref:Uncharacterized protein n=1 Tax=Halocaridina rubra TaxID=373956 RepID=A0AAN9A280_HALRR
MVSLRILFTSSFKYVACMIQDIQAAYLSQALRSSIPRTSKQERVLRMLLIFLAVITLASGVNGRPQYDFGFHPSSNTIGGSGWRAQNIQQGSTIPPFPLNYRVINYESDGDIIRLFYVGGSAGYGGNGGYTAYSSSGGYPGYGGIGGNAAYSGGFGGVSGDAIAPCNACYIRNSLDKCVFNIFLCPSK